MNKRNIATFVILTVSTLISCSCDRQPSRENYGQEPQVIYEQEWSGPGWYYGVWFNRERDYYNWRHQRRYNRRYRDGYWRYGDRRGYRRDHPRGRGGRRGRN